ncbi:MAG: 1-deoxy-D-xylulose-5-phosphate reductoisomerase [Corynebacterium sp.]|nr:1-deoxy-D-xylulose-5-phosphate reductoisomerase [Corynebacterium sp.]
MKDIVILGSTGSIGTQALEVIADNPHKFNVVGIAAGGSNTDLLIEQARKLALPADKVAVADPSAREKVAAALEGCPLESAEQLVREVKADTVLNALVGSLGLAATLATLELGEVLALANKESLVAGGHVVMETARPGQLVPVDSEHSAMAQCLRSGERAELARLVLTASGGPFRGQTREQMWDVTPAQAAQHPTWSMGQMNTLNSATLVNKGLELIEATLLFDIKPELIDVVVHPQSIVHSMATFVDGSTIAQASPPSMKLPISLALNWPQRVTDAQPALDFSQVMEWNFEPVSGDFPAVGLAAHVAGKGALPAVYNAANEEAAAAFLTGKIRFPQIVDCVEKVVESMDGVPAARSLSDVIEVEAAARAKAHELLQQWGK